MSDTTALRARLQRLIKHEHQVKHGSPPYCCGAMQDGPHDDLCLWDALREAIAALAPPMAANKIKCEQCCYDMAATKDRLHFRCMQCDHEWTDRAAAAPAPEGLDSATLTTLADLVDTLMLVHQETEKAAGKPLDGSCWRRYAEAVGRAALRARPALSDDTWRQALAAHAIQCPQCHESVLRAAISVAGGNTTRDLPHRKPERQALSDETLRSELEAINKIVGTPYGWGGLPLVERVILLRRQLDLDAERCKTWEAEVIALRRPLSDETLRELAEQLYESIGGDLCVCQRADVSHWCESCQGRLQLIREFARAVLARQQEP